MTIHFIIYGATLKEDSHMMVSYLGLNLNDSLNFVRLTNEMLANIKYNVLAYVVVDVKRMLRKC
jgi:hypothetical protein